MNKRLKLMSRITTIFQFIANVMLFYMATAFSAKAIPISLIVVTNIFTIYMIIMLGKELIRDAEQELKRLKEIENVFGYGGE